MTLPTAGIEGRSFGGGGLELVPNGDRPPDGPAGGGPRQSLPRLDSHVRTAGTDADSLIAETGALLSRAVPGLTARLLAAVREARAPLLRRLDRGA